MHRYTKPLLAAALICWYVLSWYGTQLHFESELADMVAAEQIESQRTANDVADSIQRNLHYVAGIPQTFQYGIRVWQGVEIFGSSTKANVLPKAEIFKRWTAEPALRDLNNYLGVIQKSLGVDQLFVVNSAGDSVASSNLDIATTSIGINYADRYWFSMASKTLPSMQYAVGKTTGIAGLYFAAPIVHGGKFQGAVIAKVDVPSLSFLASQSNIYVVDSNGVIILAHDKKLEMMSIPGAVVNTMSDAEKFSFYRRTSFVPIKYGARQGSCRLIYAANG